MVPKPTKADGSKDWRLVVDYRYLTRADGIYRVVTEAPVRDRNEAQEVPGVEREWLGALIASSLLRPPV